MNHISSLTERLDASLSDDSNARTISKTDGSLGAQKRAHSSKVRRLRVADF